MATPDPPKCPNCGSHDLRPRGKPYALYPYGLVAFLSIPVAIFHYASLPFESTCRRCGTGVRQRSAGAGCAYAAFILDLACVLGFNAIYWALVFSIAMNQ